ncbi:MAG: hypothetical protein JOZ54_03050 [Acidobacteria bacterium]|nr:hypothetical protein [Acidobacteriota bacterium]
MTAIPHTIDWNAVATEKLTRILGADNGRSTMTRALELSGLQSLQSADDLYRFAQELTAMAGFARAVGGMLSLEAIMRGARPA